MPAASTTGLATIVPFATAAAKFGSLIAGGVTGTKRRAVVRHVEQRDARGEVVIREVHVVMRVRLGRAVGDDPLSVVVGTGLAGEVHGSRARLRAGYRGDPRVAVVVGDAHVGRDCLEIGHVHVAGASVDRRVAVTAAVHRAGRDLGAERAAAVVRVPRRDAARRRQRAFARRRAGEDALRAADVDMTGRIAVDARLTAAVARELHRRRELDRRRRAARRADRRDP